MALRGNSLALGTSSSSSYNLALLRVLHRRRSLELPPMLYPSHGIFYLMNRPAMFRSDRGQERGEENKLKGSSLFEKEEVR